MNRERAGQTPCDEVIAQLWAYLDGELTDETMAEMREHLDLCSCCFPQFDFQKAFLSLLKRNAAQPVPPDVRRELFRRLLEEERAGP